jgi:hypothetical protein
MGQKYKIGELVFAETRAEKAAATRAAKTIEAAKAAYLTYHTIMPDGRKLGEWTMGEVEALGKLFIALAKIETTVEL